jgi:predicted amidohydrolase YtcJ
MKRAGIDAETMDPRDGRIERLPSDAPTGLFHEGAMRLVSKHVPPPTWEEQLVAIRTSQTYLHSLGITTWQDAIVGTTQNQVDNLPAYQHLAESGELTATVIGSLWLDRHRGPEQIAELIARRKTATSPRFRPTTVKIGVDGIAENYTASMLEPYLDESGAPTENRGIAFFDASELARFVTSLDALDFQVHFHAIGDRAVRDALDAVEAARRENGFKDTRPHIAHIQVIHPSDVPRFRGLQVIANGQPLWAIYDPQMTEATMPYLGPVRTEWQYPFGSLRAAGATIVFGSDWAVSSPNPLWGIHVAVNRTAPPGYLYAADARAYEEPFLPNERLDVVDALAAYTREAAFVNHLEGESGTIEVGKRADLALLNEDPLVVDRESLSGSEVLMTVAGGQVVYESAVLQ